MDAVVTTHGRIDVLFSCAGILAPGSVTEASLEDWDRTIAINLTGRSWYPAMSSR